MFFRTTATTNFDRLIGNALAQLSGNDAGQPIKSFSEVERLGAVIDRCAITTQRGGIGKNSLEKLMRNFG